jgi:hypothetical protein
MARRQRKRHPELQPSTRDALARKAIEMQKAILSAMELVQRDSLDHAQCERYAQSSRMFANLMKRR